MYKHFFKFCSESRQSKITCFIWIGLLFSSVLINACSKNKNIHEQYLYFEGEPNKKVMLYKVITDKNKDKYLPIQTISTQNKYKMQEGIYLAANECSSYLFDLKQNETKHIDLSILKLKFINEFDDVSQTLQNEEINDHFVDVQCKNIITGEKIVFSRQDTFDLLPGKNQITISGTEVNFSILENDKKFFSISLAPLKVISPIENDTTQYFIKSDSTDKNFSGNILYSGHLNQNTWLIPGEYELELNGTTTKINLNLDRGIKISLGRLHVLKPKDFGGNEQSKNSLQPIFVYINKKILFSLDKDYAIFPGKYLMSLENSEMEKEIEILPNSYLKIPTFIAQINPPQCVAEPKRVCFLSQKALIYSKDRPYPIAKVGLGVPFLVLQGDYAYSIEGTDKIIKDLSISDHTLKNSQTGKIKIKWKLELGSNNPETRKIYLESRCCNLLGKSEDLNTYRPRELILPEGEYHLNYVIKQNKGGLKYNTTLVHVDGQHDVELQIPVYANSNQNQNLFWHDEHDQDTQQPSNLVPLVQ